jgi:signal transduction histidine kinase
LLWIVSWPFFAIVTVLLSIGVAVEPGTLARRVTTVAAVGTLTAILHAISRAGRPLLASWVLVIGLSIIVTQRAWITGGIHAPVAVFYVLFIVMAAVLIGARGGFATAAVCVAGAVILTVGTAMSWLTPRPGAGSPVGGLVFVILAIGLALLIQAVLTLGQRREVPGLTAQMLVHDMRSPLQALLANLHLLRDGVRGESVKDLDGAIEGATTLNRMTTTLLELGRIDAGQLPVRVSTTDLLTLAQSVVTSIRILQPGRSITVEGRGDATCACDPDLTRRIIENLVGNAMKHTSIEGHIRVVVAGLRETVEVSVTDEGPGITPKLRTRIFEPYETGAPQNTTGHQSLGLGLAFCKLASEAQGGKIRVEAAVPRGSVFTFDLPRTGGPS